LIWYFDDSSLFDKIKDKDMESSIMDTTLNLRKMTTSDKLSVMELLWDDIKTKAGFYV
jgi:hypothetical protein